MNRKKRILWIGESSFLSTGFSVYGKEVLSRLYLSGKYDIAELGAYGYQTDIRCLDLPWTYYCNMPVSPAEEEEYRSHGANQWGRWRIHDVLLDFKPDIVCDIRDWWMMEFVEHNVFRDMFHWSIMPTIDSAPQREQWLSTYLNADSVCAYSEFGRNVLMDESNGRVKFHNIASPAADYDVWKPHPNKKELRGFLDLEENIFIVGTVMRNQKRKLYPELISAFKDFLIKYPELGKKTFLYCHTAYPDLGWDIPRLIRESGIGHKILFTYACQKCKHVFPSFFQDATQTCPRCKTGIARMPTSDRGIDNRQLSNIVNCFDIYVQYSICEGFGMPQIEAAACGVPIMAVNYSAMESVLKNLKGIPIRVQTLFREAETHSYRAYPDNNDFVEKLANFLNKPQDLRLKAGKDTYLLCRQNYTWDKTANVWDKIFDSVLVRPEVETWKRPPRILRPNLDIPTGLTNEQFVYWCIVNIWGEPQQLNSYVGLRMIRDLNYGQSILGNGGIFYDEESAIYGNTQYRPFVREQVVDELVQLAEERNHWEEIRTSTAQREIPGFIQLAKKEKQ